MKTTRLLLLAAIGAGVYYLLKSDNAQGLRDTLTSKAGDLRDKLSDLASNTTDSISSLKNAVAKQASGLTNDAKDKIMSILDEAGSSTDKVKGMAEKQLS